MQGSQWTAKQREARLAKLVERNRSINQGARLFEDAEWMRATYVERGLTLREVASEADCALRTIARWMQIHGIPTRTDARPRARVGAAHPNWTGGKPSCQKCGEPLGWYGSVHHQACRDRSGSKGSRWRGDDIEYTAAHGRVRALRGKPSEHRCAHCGEDAAGWAYDHEDPNEKRNLVGRDDGPYSVDPNHYLPLCVSCHRLFDARPKIIDPDHGRR